MSVNPRNSRPIDFSLPLVDPATGRIAKGWMRLIEDLVKSRDQTVTDAGQIHDVAPIKGRTEGIGTTVAHHNNDGTFDSTDNVGDGVYSLRSFQQSGSALVIDNSGFEATSTSPIPGWVNVNAVSFAIDAGNPQSGKNALKITFSAQFQAVGSKRVYSVRPGDSFRISGWTRSDGTSQPYIQLSIFDKNGNLIGTAGTTPNGTTSWVQASATIVAPANASYAQIWLTTNSASVNQSAWFDSLQGSRTLTSFEVTPNNTAGTPRTTTGLVSQVGATTAMNIASSTWQFGDGTVAYNSGSADPGILGTYAVTGDDSSFSGGAIVFTPRATIADANAANGRLLFGNITTTGGGSVVSTGGGSGGGGPKSKAALA